jgi:hypothetical protein
MISQRADNVLAAAKRAYQDAETAGDYAALRAAAQTIEDAIIMRWPRRDEWPYGWYDSPEEQAAARASWAQS